MLRAASSVLCASVELARPGDLMPPLRDLHRGFAGLAARSGAEGQPFGLLALLRARGQRNSGCRIPPQTPRGSPQGLNNPWAGLELTGRGRGANVGSDSLGKTSCSQCSVLDPAAWDGREGGQQGPFFPRSGWRLEGRVVLVGVSLPGCWVVVGWWLKGAGMQCNPTQP